MNNMKNIHRLLALMMTIAALIACLSGCGKAKNEEEAELKQDLTKIGDYLYETFYTDDFDWNIPNQSVDTENGAFACSAIQMGRFRGRNYDWYYDDTNLCVVHASKTESRHASVGIADLSFITSEDGTVDLAQLPFVTVDGINDAGVCIQVNVMPYGENGEIPHTEYISDDLPGGRLVRFVLDYADSVEDALNLLKDKDIDSAFETLEELHWMISGPAANNDNTIKTVVLEIFPDGQHVTEKFAEDVPIMTNFNVSNFDGTPATVGMGLGYERWQILKENASQASSVMGTFDLMEKVFFSKMYDLYGERFWYSEYNMTNLCDYYSEEDLKMILGEDIYEFYMTNFSGVYYTADLWDGEKSIAGDISKTGCLAAVVEAVDKTYQANEPGLTLWITVETSVYDLENLTLDLQVRESQDHYHFSVE